MAEYIEREAAVKALLKDAAFCVRHLQDGEGRGYIGASKTIRSIPAADVEPVRRGRWLTWEEQFPGKTPKKKNALGVFCDQCHNRADNMTDWCPNCGARMDGGDDDGE